MGHNFIMTRTDPQMRIRLPAELKKKINESASGEGRSQNAEVVHRLEMSFRTTDSIPATSIDDLHQTMKDLLQELKITGKNKKPASRKKRKKQAKPGKQAEK